MKRLEVKVKQHIAKTPQEVYNAITDKDKMTSYFAHEAGASMTEGADITWSFGIYGKGVVHVKSLLENKQIIIEWEGKQTEFYIEPEDGGTSSIVKLTETGWEDFSPENVAEALDRTEGWTDMLLCMKAYLQHGVDLREPARVTESA